MKNVYHKHSRHQQRCTLARLRGYDVGDATEVVSYSPQIDRGEHRVPTLTGSYFEESERRPTAYCGDLPDELPF